MAVRLSDIGHGSAPAETGVKISCEPYSSAVIERWQRCAEIGAEHVLHEQGTLLLQEVCEIRSGREERVFSWIHDEPVTDLRHALHRSEARRVGKECVRTCRSRGHPNY